MGMLQDLFNRMIPKGTTMENTIVIKDVRKSLEDNPNGVRWDQYNRRRSLAGIKLISVHHTADNINDIQKINRAEMHNTLNGSAPYGCQRIPYHFWINEKAQAYWCNDLEEVTWTVNYANPIAISVAVVGNYENQVPSEQVLKTLQYILEFARKQTGLPIAKVSGHGELTAYRNYTACPGKHLLPKVIQYRLTGSVL